MNSPACLANSTSSSGGGGGLVNSAGSLLGATDLRPSSRDSGRGGGTPVACSSTTTATNSGGNGNALGGLDRSSPRSQRDRSERSAFGSGGIPSPLSEPIAGPSGMGPVQQVPLVSWKLQTNTLKKENQISLHGTTCPVFCKLETLFLYDLVAFHEMLCMLF